MVEESCRIQLSYKYSVSMLSLVSVNIRMMSVRIGTATMRGKKERR